MAVPVFRRESSPRQDTGTGVHTTPVPVNHRPQNETPHVNEASSCPTAEEGDLEKGGRWEDTRGMGATVRPPQRSATQ